MRILFWSANFWPQIGGLEVFATQLASGLKRRGHELTVIAGQPSPQLPRYSVYDGIPVHRFPLETTLIDRDIVAMQAIRRDIIALKRELKPDLAHVHFSGACDFFYQRSLTPYDPPTLLTVHSPLSLVNGGVTDKQSNALHADALRTATWVNGVSQALIDDLCAFMPNIAPHASVIYNGLTQPDLIPTPLSCHPPRLLCIGRVVAEKGFDIALRALPTILAQYPQSRLVIAGDGAARVDLEALALSLGVGHAVEFTGWVPPDVIPALINTTSLVVMPSRWREPFGLVALQAGQMARPIVATRVGGLPEVVTHGETGLLVESEDVAGLARAVLGLLDDPALATRMGASGRHRAQTVFSFDHCVDQYDALYRELGQRP